MNIKYLLTITASLFVASIISSCKDKDDDDVSLNSYQETKEYGETFLRDKKTEAGIVESSTGLLIKVNTLGKSEVRPEDGDTVYAIVTANKIENKQNEFRHDTLKYVTMNGQVPALKEGIKYMTEGSDFDFWSPYYLAYGGTIFTGWSRDLKQKVTVNPYSAVKFNVRLIKVKKEDK